MTFFVYDRDDVPRLPFVYDITLIVIPWKIARGISDVLKLVNLLGR